MNDEDKIRICNFWLKYPHLLGENLLDDNDDEVNNLIVLISGEGREFTIDKVENYKQRLESHILQKSSHDLQKKGVSYKRDIVIISITLILTAIITNMDRIIKFIVMISN